MCIRDRASASSITVTWADNSTNETGFNVYRATVANGLPGLYSIVGTMAAQTGTNNNLSFVDTNVVGSTTYRYQVAATNNGTQSAYACTARTTCTATSTPNYVAVTTPVPPNLTAPSNVMVQMTGANAETLTFTDLATSETRYVVQVSTDSGKSWGDGTNTTFTQTAPAYLATANRSAAQTTGSGTAVTVSYTHLTLPTKRIV